MEYKVLGNTGVTVSRLCMGTMTFGREADEATSLAMFNRCREVGINFFDCANTYKRGGAEELLGKFIKDCRDELVITSKVGMGMGDGPNAYGLSRRHIMMQCEASLKRLGTDRIDVYFCHHEDTRLPIEETLRALDDLVKQGKILYIGLSNFTAYRITRIIGKMELMGLSPIHVLEPMYNLTKRTAEVEILPMAKAENLGVISYGPLGGGLLTGKYSVDKKAAEGRLTQSDFYARRYGDERYFRMAEEFTAYANKIGVHPATLAVAWVKANPSVTAPIIGARSLEQLEPSLAAADFQLNAQQYDEISAINPWVPEATDRDETRPKKA